MDEHIRRVPTTPEAERHHARRVLIVDRATTGRPAEAAALIAAGFEVVAPLADPRPVGEIAGTVDGDAPDAIVLAVSGPDDLAVLAELRAGDRAPVVVLAPDASPDLVAGARDAGAQAFLPSTTSVTSLVPAVEVAIARHAETAALRAEVATVRRSLENRKLIDRAKGLLMTHRGMSEPEAFRWIQRTAMDRRKSSAAVAGQIIAEHERMPTRAAS